MDLFTLLERSGKTAAEIADALGFSCQGTERFLAALRALGLVMESGGYYYNTAVSSEYLVRGKNGYQGNSILWRKMLVRSWRGIIDCLKAGGRVDYLRTKILRSREVGYSNISAPWTMWRGKKRRKSFLFSRVSFRKENSLMWDVVRVLLRQDFWSVFPH